MERKTRIFIVDDYPSVRADLRTVLELVEGVEVVGEAANGAGALHLAGRLRPDIVLIDLDIDRSRPNLWDACDIIRQIITLAPDSTVYVLSSQRYPAIDLPGLPAGVAAAFTKGIDTGRLLERVSQFKIENIRSVEMQSTRGAQFGPIEQVKPSVLPREGVRLAYIDTLRMVLIVLVIMVHAAVTYGSLGEWTYEDPVQDELSAVVLSFFVIASQSFFMGLYFFLAGCFTPRSYDRKGMASYWKDRLLRLGVPMVAYTWFLCKIPNYIDDVANNGMRLSFGEYFVSHFWLEVDEGPTWFLFALLIFSAGYTLWRLATRGAESQWAARLPTPNTRTLLLVGVVMAVMTFIVSQFLQIGEMYDVFGIFSLQLQFFPTYIVLFAAGVLAYRSDWLSKLPAKMLRFWAWFSAGLLVALPVLFFLGGATEGHLDEFMTGLNWRCMVFSLWLGLACVSFSTTLTLWLRDRVWPKDRLAAFAGPNNFAVYLIHPLVLVPIALGLSYLALPGLAKFALASASTVIVCYALAHLLRRLPGLRSIL